jgi:hypothetical protein
MHEFIDAVELFAGIVNGLIKKQFEIHSPLNKIVLKTSRTNLAYVDNRRDAREKYHFDFWDGIKNQFKDQTAFKNFMKNIDEKIWYSKSEQFPDFLFKVKKKRNKLTNGILLELKNSHSGSIASFNSTLPSKYKSLDEIDTINGTTLVLRIASVMDGKLSSDKNYRTFQRRNFYLVRTYKDNNDKVKISVVDGSFFETVPKEHLIYQMFLNILRNHLEKKQVEISSKILNEIKKSLHHITDQTIIAASQIIEKASVRPRLRIMAEVHPEGNPHSKHYSQISERSVNLIIKASSYEEEISKWLSKKTSHLKVFTIKHKRNGEHVVFQFRF